MEPENDCCWRLMFDKLFGNHLQSHLTLKMASAQVVETSVANNSPCQGSIQACPSDVKWLWRWLPYRLLKHQLPTTLSPNLRTAFTQLDDHFQLRYFTNHFLICLILHCAGTDGNYIWNLCLFTCDNCNSRWELRPTLL